MSLSFNIKHRIFLSYNYEQVDMLVLDFAKAFDTVAHKRLLRKLESYGIDGNLYGWIQSFLEGRTQRVVADGETSGPAAVKSGAPQGSVLGPLLLLLLLSTHSSLIIGGSPLLLSDGGSPPASPASHLAGLLRRRDPSTNPGPIAWWVSVGN